MLSKILVYILVLHFCTQNVLSSFRYKRSFQKLEIYLDNRLILQHSEEYPAVEIGVAKARYQHDLGNFDVSQKVFKRVALFDFDVQDLQRDAAEEDGTLGESPFVVRFSSYILKTSISVEFTSSKSINTMRVSDIENKTFNRLWLRLHAEASEHIYGGGEQFSYFSLRGRSYPMWTREQGVGRNKSTLITYLADKIAGAGGDYYTTYWPQATIVSDRLYFAHLNYSFYSVLNFSALHYHELELWEDISKVEVHFGTATSWQQLLQGLTSFIGRQPMPPSWLYNGAVMGLQGGTDQVLRRYTSLKNEDVKISAIWIQDWSGKKMTSLGKRVYWNWRWDKEMYPNLKEVIQRFKTEEKVRFLAYINPHIINGSDMFNYAHEKEYFIKSAKTGTTQLVDFGEMFCGSVDLTNPDAYAWYKTVLKDMIKVGFSGWMADFGGEYLPTEDTVYSDGRSPAEMHNAYSELWAKLNKEAVIEMEILDDTFIFMRSGFGKSPNYTLVSWGGDQNVDFSYSDGLASVVPAALSLGMSGMGFHHSDIGGYVSLICMVRTEELILRWAEMSIFTPVMRTHEGNRPYRNWQVYTSNGTLKAFARLTKIFSQLSPYHAFVAKETADYGFPAQRPLFFHYPNDPETYEIKYQYLYGSELLIAPVLFEDQHTQDVYLPPDEWVYLWNGSVVVVEANKSGEGRVITVKAEIGNPPVFYRRKTTWKRLFGELESYAIKVRRESEGLSWHLLWNEPIIFLFLLPRELCWYIFFNV